jgi:hypothetical protein
MHADLDRAMADAGDGPLGRSLALVRHFMRGDWDRLSSSVAEFDLEAAAGGIEVAGRGFLWYPVMIMRELELGRELDRWLVERNPLDAGLWSQVVDVELLAGERGGGGTAVEPGAGDGARAPLPGRIARTDPHRQGPGRGRSDDGAAPIRGLPSWRPGPPPWPTPRLGQLDRARAACWSRTSCGAIAAAGCWPGSATRVAANACATAIDAEPLGWVRLARVIVDDRSVPFDPEAAPRFTARYRASGAPPWPRTEAVLP